MTLNTIKLQLSDAVADTSMLQCPAHFQIPLTSVCLVANNATHVLASTATVKLTLIDEDEVDAICNEWTPEEEKERRIIHVYKYMYDYILFIYMHKYMQ